MGRHTLGALVLVVAPLVVAATVRAGGLTLPEKIGDLTRTRYVTGDGAFDELSRIHGTRLTFKDGAVARYEQAGQGLDVYLTQLGSDTEAAAILQAMVQGLTQAGPEPRRVREFTVEEVTLYSVKMRGRTNIFFRVSDRIAWLALDRGLPKETYLKVLALLK